MKQFDWMPESLELVAITYSSDAIFAQGSSRLTSRGYAELERVAHMLALLPHMPVNVDVHFDVNLDEAKQQPLWRQRFRALRHVLSRKGVDHARIRTTIEMSVQRQQSEITLSLKTSDAAMLPAVQSRPSYENPLEFGSPMY